MTIRMLIVDDEPIICQGLRHTLPWESIGVEVVGEAYDGWEALQFVSRESVDLVLTDIHMDGMDGLELAKKLKERMPHIRIIIISGYEDFEYARSALRLGIEDYLLKPVNIDELLTMVKRINMEITKEAEQGHKNEHERRLKWLTQLIQGEGIVQKETIFPTFTSTDIHSFRFIASQLEDYAGWVDHSSEELQHSVRSEWEKAVATALKGINQEVISFFHHPNLLLSLCVGPRGVDSRELATALTDTQDLMSEFPRLQYGISPVYSSLDHVYPSYMQAVSVLQQSVLSDFNKVQFYEQEQTLRKCLLPFAPFELEKQLVHVLFYGSFEELDDIIRGMMQEFREKGYLLKEILQAIKELSIILHRKLHSNGIDLSQHTDYFNTYEIDLQVHNSSRAMETILRRELRALSSIIHSSLEGKHHWITERVKKFIESRHTTDLKASEVAAWLKITPNYFSIIFKQNFGKGFAEYLNEVRIDHAKASLVSTEERVFEIAENVGYREYKYFCSIFKSYTGITPTQYRKLAQTTSDSMRQFV
ncbi:response regulator [Paenibacillus periandrae]|uniref:response regulator n=1 Tax=Paenibacillus periandrae TaxID=1761741 RepID=UPI001F09271F|nr:response regulator [Paenibacillus periandrae]